MTPTSSSPISPEDLLAHAGFVRGLARALVSGDHDVDDVVQETWLAALRSSGSRIRRPRSWLASIVRGRAARLHRTRARMDRRHAEGARLPAVPTPEDLAARHEVIQKVSAALATLPAPQRDALVLRYQDELPPREIARKLGIPVETARTRVRRGLVRLREIVDEAHGGDRRAWAMPLSAFLSSGMAPVSVGALVTGGLAVAALLLLGFALASWPWSKEALPPAERAEPVQDEAASPILRGRSGPRSDAAALADLAAPSDTAIGTSAKSEGPADDIVDVLVRVVDEKGQPVEGLGVCEILRGPGGPMDVVAHTLGTTDAVGEVAAWASVNSIGLRIERNDAWHMAGRSAPFPGAGGEAVIRVLPGILVKGTLLDASGLPLAGVLVRGNYATRSSPGSNAFAFTMYGPTDEDGHFTASLPAYTAFVTFSASAGDASASVRIDPIRKREVVLRARPPVRITGEILAGEDAATFLEGPVRPRINAWPLSDPSIVHTCPPLPVGSNAFALTVPRAGRYRLTVSWEPRNTSPLGTPDPMIIDAPAEGVRLVCSPAHELAGRIEGDDVGGFRTTWVRHTGTDRTLWARRYTQTDAAGRFALKGVTDGDTLLYIHRPGDERYALLERVRLPAKDLGIPLRRGLAIRGRVPGYAGRLGFDLYLVFTWRGPEINAKVQDDGTFSVTGLPPGTYRVHWERAWRRGDLDLALEAGGDDVEIVVPAEAFRMGETRSVTGGR